jgi:hypothetical protein
MGLEKYFITSGKNGLGNLRGEKSSQAAQGLDLGNLGGNPAFEGAVQRRKLTMRLFELGVGIPECLVGISLLQR